MKFNTIGIIAKPNAAAVKDTLDHLTTYLKNKTCTILFDEGTGEFSNAMLDSKDIAIVDRKSLCEQSDLAIVIGGDGTILHAARSLADNNVPLVGINIGRLGFLADISPGDIDSSLDSILSGDYLREERMLLNASVIRGNKTIFSADALNDVVVHIRDVARMMEFETQIDGHYVNHQRADGLIVSTPTGSTAYALSSGGPILHANLDAITLVPISPHTLTNRPIVVSSDSEVQISIIETKKAIAQVTCDGQSSFDVAIGDHITIKRKQGVITLLHPPGYDYYNILRAKLLWSEHP